MKNIFFILFAALIALSPLAPAVAQEKPAIAIVDVKKILNDSLATKSIQTQIEEKRKSVQTEISKQEEALRKTDQELSQQKSVLSPEAFDKKVNEFKTKVAEAQRNVQTKRSQLESSYADALAEVEKVVISIVTELSDKQGFSVAIPKSNALYSKSSLDISDQVLSTLNERLPKVKVKSK